MKWNREEYIELVTYGKVDRPMFVELFGLLVGLDKEWEAQGATKDEIELDAFDFDYVPLVNCGGSTVLRSGITPCIIEETDEYSIALDAYGRKTKLCKGKKEVFKDGFLKLSST